MSLSSARIASAWSVVMLLVPDWTAQPASTAAAASGRKRSGFKGLVLRAGELATAESLAHGRRGADESARGTRHHEARPGGSAMKYLHTMVRVTDLDASLDFYCNKLG